MKLSITKHCSNSVKCIQTPIRSVVHNGDRQTWTYTTAIRYVIIKLVSAADVAINWLRRVLCSAISCSETRRLPVVVPHLTIHALCTDSQYGPPSVF